MSGQKLPLRMSVGVYIICGDLFMGSRKKLFLSLNRLHIVFGPY